MATAVVNTLEGLDRELETVLTSFDTSYAWNYGSVKDGLRDLYEKSKREQWNGTTQLAWQTSVDPEAEISDGDAPRQLERGQQPQRERRDGEPGDAAER